MEYKVRKYTSTSTNIVTNFVRDTDYYPDDGNICSPKGWYSYTNVF